VGATLVALPIVILTATWAPWPALVMALLATVAGLWSCPWAIRHFGVKDPSQVVIDEVAGVWLGMALIPPTLWEHAPYATAGLVFVFFRLFDVAKPWPLPILERMPGGWGIMADDLLAGLLAGLCALVVLA
jgi:phosphatidylglycerophosphatase A